MNGKLGSASAVIYFVNHTDPRHWPGYIMLAPYSEFHTPEGYSREVADDLPSLRKLEQRMNNDATREWREEYFYSETGLFAFQEKKRAELRSKMYSAATTPYERDFIEEWLKLKDEKKRDRYKEFFEHRQIVLHQLHYDTPKDRDADEEKVDLDRIG